MGNYWKSLDEYKGIKIAENDTTENKSPGISLIEMLEEKNRSSRRDFLKFFGFSISSAALLASCERPVTKAIPYLVKPEEVTPGMANYYASTFFDGLEYNSILVKVRDGRPIKIEGNDMSPLTKGGTSANVQASVLGLYDDSRTQNPLKNGENSTWNIVDNEIIQKLKSIKSKNGKIVILSPSVISPSTLSVIKDFQSTYTNTAHVVYDASSFAAMLDANEKTFGIRKVPRYNFEKAKVILSLGADFLGTWLSPVEFTKQYAATRKINKTNPGLSKHIQIETGLSMTGSNADKRIPVKPSQMAAIIAKIYNQIALVSGGMKISAPECLIETDDIVKQLLQNRGKSLVVCGINDVTLQTLVNGINQLLGNYGNTIDMAITSNLRSGSDKALEKLVNDMGNGSIDALIIYDANPAYDSHLATQFKGNISKVGLTVSLNYGKDETSTLVQYVCPDNHFLESWNDAEPYQGNLSLVQPAIRTIYNTRQAQESLLKWSGNQISYLDYLKAYWENNVYAKLNVSGTFFNFWNQSLHDGIVLINGTVRAQPGFNDAALAEISGKINEEEKGTFEIDFYESVAIRTGKHANNPWLQEMPDPVSKVTWDNYAALSPKFAEDNQLSQTDIITINNTIQLPVLIQPGQAYGTISVAMGYGRQVTGVAAKDVGVDIHPMVGSNHGYRANWTTGTSLEKTGTDFVFAQTQTHHSMEGRAIVRETSLEEYLENPSSGNELHEEIEKELTTMYPKPEFKGHHWGMAIDLNSCTGCSACVIACSSENNVPIVGKREVSRVHDMQWIRIDRYYHGDPENPEVLRQPVMCQQCDNAPCENVCPVAATNHSNEGLNQMIYNRCIGTRYCNNNCPYKVRRFNFFDFNKADAIPNNTVDPSGMTLDIRRMVLNPDVTVRAKGVIEKCSFCVQRIQEKKLQAKLEGRILRDGEIKTACMQSCPADAIVFGDLNDKESTVSKMFADKRNYHVLEELHTLPSVGYLTKVRNV